MAQLRGFRPDQTILEVRAGLKTKKAIDPLDDSGPVGAMRKKRLEHQQLIQRVRSHAALGGGGGNALDDFDAFDCLKRRQQIDAVATDIRAALSISWINARQLSESVGLAR